MGNTGGYDAPNLLQQRRLLFKQTIVGGNVVQKYSSERTNIFPARSTNHHVLESSRFVTLLVENYLLVAFTPD